MNPHDKKLNGPITRYYSKNRVILTKDFSARVGGLIFVVKKGFVTDGASVPRFFWSLGFDRFNPQTMAASTVHDALCKSNIIPRAAADSVFNAILKDWHWKYRWLYWLGVRIGAWWEYLFGKSKKYKPEKALKFISIKSIIL